MTLQDPRGLVDRLHRTLVEEIRSSSPDYLREPFTVAEIYQQLVPYKTHRDAIGVEMNADYEDALLRLLAGQGGYLRLESEAAVRKIRDELETRNPDTTLYREFAAMEVRLNPERLPDGGDGNGDSAYHAGPAVEKAGTGPVRTLEEEGPDGSGVPSGGAAKPPGRSGATPVGSCRSCGEPLPEREDLIYCPRCGADQRKISCPSCGTELEPGWRFCVACGEELEG